MPDTGPPSEVVIVGAGAAGILAALFAARAGRRTTLLEGTRDGGRKILISGGGRCNILPERVEPDRFVTASSMPSLRKILRSWPLGEQIEFFERELSMRLVLEKETGKWFPETHRARDVRDRLLERVRESGARIEFGKRVSDLVPPGDGRPGWRVDCADGTRLDAGAVVLATGGLSVPATGSDGVGLRIARALGHDVHPTYPALTPLLADPPVHAHLAGVSLDVTLRAPGSRPRFSTRGGFLFTHRGYSGPTVLDASHLAVASPEPPRAPQSLRIQWCDRTREEWDRALLQDGGTAESRVAQALPLRLARQLLQEASVPPDAPSRAIPRAARARLLTLLTDYPLPWSRTEGYAKAEVTGGGVSLAEVDPRTLESRRHRGLFLCGEILDSFGPIGGHNFLWAWATGRAAGLGAARATG